MGDENDADRNEEVARAKWHGYEMTQEVECKDRVGLMHIEMSDNPERGRRTWSSDGDN